MLQIMLMLLIPMVFSVPALALREEGNMAITILFDNYQFNKELEKGWGFSCLVEGAEKTILFDIGSSKVPTNMKKLGIDPESVDVVVFSHYHGDHTDGTPAFLEVNSDVDVYVLQSFPDSFKDSVKNTGARCIDVHDPAKICQNVHSTGELGTLKEQSLVIRTGKGLVLITGCAHPGIVKIVKKAREMFDGEDIYLAMGGFHLLKTEVQQVEEIIAELQKENVKKAAPTHCTGDRAIALFKEKYGDDFISAGVGKKIDIENAFSKASD